MPNKFIDALAQELDQSKRGPLIVNAVERLPWDKVVVPTFASLYESGLDILTAQCRVIKPIFEALYQAPLPASDLPFPANDVEPLAIMEPFYQEVFALLQLALDNNERREIVTCIQGLFVAYSDPKGQNKEGVVFTPDPVVDFMNRSIQEILIKHFGVTISDPGVGMHDPFTGAGIYVYRLLANPELVPTERLLEKAEEILAFELMPVSAYLARLNINLVFRERLGITYDEGKEIVWQGNTFAAYEQIMAGKHEPTNRVEHRVRKHIEKHATQSSEPQMAKSMAERDVFSFVTLSLEDFEHDKDIERTLD